jgi:hypothetical protein
MRMSGCFGLTIPIRSNGGRRGDLGDFAPLDGLIDLDGVAALLDCCDLAFI